MSSHISYTATGHKDRRKNALVVYKLTDLSTGEYLLQGTMLGDLEILLASLGEHPRWKDAEVCLWTVCGDINEAFRLISEIKLDSGIELYREDKSLEAGKPKKPIDDIVNTTIHVRM